MKIETLLKQLRWCHTDLEGTLNPMSGAHLRTEDIQDHTQGRIPCKDDVRDCSDSATSQGSHKKLGRGKGIIFL